MTRISPTTWVYLAAAAAAVALVHVDPWEPSGPVATYVSERSAARRVFPWLSDADPRSVHIALASTGAERVELVPIGSAASTGLATHQVLLDGHPLGPADPDAIDGLLASLRMATTLRAVEEGAALPPVQRGTLEITGPSASSRVLLGDRAPEGTGLYGTLREGPEGEDVSVWVVEDELGQALAQRPEAWLARRAVVVDPGQVVAVRFAGAGAFERHPDGLWRSHGDAGRAILSSAAVEGLVARLVAARLDPWVTRRDRPQGEPFVELETRAGETLTLGRGGPCPGREERTIIDRGPGWAGCLPTALVEPWPLPGSGPDGDALVDTHLLPHPLARVLRIERVTPAGARLVRRGGEWQLETDGRSTPIGPMPVLRWYEALRDAEVVPDAPPETPVVDVELRLDTDANAWLRVQCATAARPIRCRRDDGPWLRVEDEIPPLAFARETFAERTLVELEPGEARAIEVRVPGQPGATQRAHLDFGVWRLDAPALPTGDAALHEEALEQLLAVLGGLRAQGWVEPPAGAPRRVLTVEQVPYRGRPTQLQLELWDDCRVRVKDRAARVGASECATLQRDLLQGDPIADALATARRAERSGGARARWRRVGPALVLDAGAPDDDAWLSTLRSVGSARVQPGAPDEPATDRLRIVPEAGAPFAFELGPGWARLEGAGWHYRW